jgi:hypothetical protein
MSNCLFCTRINSRHFYLILRGSKAQVQTTNANLTDCTAHDYEVIDKYAKEYEEVVEMDLTKCPAYEPVRQT